MIIKVFKRLSNEFRFYLRSWKYKNRLLKKTNYTIISSNCIGGSIYKDFNLPFNSPTIGSFIHGQDFVRFCSRLSYYLSLDLVEITVSKWVGAVSYPVGLLEDVEIHFLHYESFESAKIKWERRRARVGYENLFFIMTDRDFSTYKDMKDFDRLDGKKLLFSSVPHQEISSLVYCAKYRKAGQVGGMLPLFMEYSDYVDIVNWLDE
ncbi:DUF1919 domain-containing protein [Saccharospirillum sp. HFRX-1]|uniref:DUF1919 domain-containing protein n=1 Tax=unclassified Saccharospirillum TaxID=2633430 RepID=UPI003711DEA3